MLLDLIRLSVLVKMLTTPSCATCSSRSSTEVRNIDISFHSRDLYHASLGGEGFGGSLNVASAIHWKPVSLTGT
jgi:hypothetical protein